MPSSYLSAMHLRVCLRLPTAPVTLLRWRANYYAPPHSQDGRYDIPKATPPTYLRWTGTTTSPVRPRTTPLARGGGQFGQYLIRLA